MFRMQALKSKREKRSSFNVRLFSSTITYFRAAKNTFQTHDAFEKIIAPIIKPADGSELTRQLRLLKDFTPYRKPTNPLIFTDLGGGQGHMLLYLMALETSLRVNINEIDITLAERYKKEIDKLQKREGDRSAKKISLGFVSNKQMEDPSFEIPKSDIILASHSLYYMIELWREPITITNLQNHFITKLLLALKPDGVLSVILKSVNTEKVESTNANLPTLELLESLVYPKINRINNRMGNKNSPNLVCAEAFGEVMDNYAGFFNKETKKTLRVVSSEPIISNVPLGKINFQPDLKTGKYVQSGRAKLLLNFYTRGTYDQFQVNEQEELLEFIKSTEKIDEDEHVVTHVNKIISVQINDNREAHKKLNT